MDTEQLIQLILGLVAGTPQEAVKGKSSIANLAKTLAGAGTADARIRILQQQANIKALEQTSQFERQDALEARKIAIKKDAALNRANAASKIIAAGQPGHKMIEGAISDLMEAGEPELAAELELQQRKQMELRRVRASRIASKALRGDLPEEAANAIAAYEKGDIGSAQKFRQTVRRLGKEKAAGIRVAEFQRLAPTPPQPKPTAADVYRLGEERVRAGLATPAQAAAEAETQIAKIMRRGSLLKSGGLAVGAAVALPVVLRMIFGGKQEGAPQLSPEQQFALAQQMQGAQSGSADSRRTLMDMSRLLGMIRTLQDMSGVLGQPAPAARSLI